MHPDLHRRLLRIRHVTRDIFRLIARPFWATNGGGMSCWNIAARTDSRASRV